MKNKFVLGTAIAALMMTAPAYAQSARGEMAREAAWDERGNAKYFFGGLALAFVVGVILVLISDEDNEEEIVLPPVPVSP